MEGSKVYVNDEEHGWLKATLLRVNAETRHAEVELEADEVIGIAGGESRIVDMTHPDLAALNDGHGVAKTPGAVAAAGLPLQNLRLPALGVEDLSSLGFLHAPALLFTIRARHLAQQPYTWSSNIIISVNPYEVLEDLYSDENKTAYALAKTPSSELPPHIYAISSMAYHDLGSETGKNQSILVSGESGAGKTEVCKQIMAHLATIASSDSGRKEDNSIVAKVLESNPLLESFGNAQTVRNDNSSRFGKFTQLQFYEQAGKKPLLVGSKCDTYLLEGSRVVHHSMGERNYHVFYQLLAASEEVKARVGLSGKTVKDFHYMVCDHGGSKTSEIEGESDSVRFQATAHALSLIGLEAEEQEQLWGILAGILHLGQVQFRGEEGTSGDEEARIKEVASDESGGGALGQAAALLLGDEGGAAALGKALTSRTVRTRTETYAVPMAPAQAVDARDALAKALYQRLFDWLVVRINASTFEGESAGHVSSAPTSTLGLLDIFGFESFAVNRYEQLCINFCNERLQQRYVADVFKSVQQEYEEEGIAWDFVEFADNAPVLDLIEGRMGLITVLNEECMLAKGTDSAFASKLKAIHADMPLLIGDRLNQLDFTIKHYAGPVKYTAAGFVSKNRDKLLEDLSQTLATSRKPLVQALFLNDEDIMSPTNTLTSSSSSSSSGNGNKNSTSNNQPKKKGGGSIVAETVATKFKRQLHDLMETVAATRVQYIRCIKPNSSKQARVMEPRMVLDQLRYAGVIEAIRISRSAYPNRLSHSDFVQRFRLLAPSAAGVAPGQDEAAQARGLLQYLLPLPSSSSSSSSSSTPSSSAAEAPATRPRWEMGRTRVYFTKGSLEGLEEARLLVLNRQATTLQRYFRGSRQAKAFRQLRQQAITVQSAVRAWRQRASYRKERARVVQLQALWRRKRATKFVHARRLEARATTLQTAFRAHLQRARYYKARAGTIRLQALARRQQARKAYVVAVAEAKEQAKLENQLEALKRRLEEESEARRTAERKLHEAATNSPSALPQQHEPEPTSGLEAVEQEGSQDAIDTSTSSLSQEQGQLLEQLGRKVHSYREKYLRFKGEAEKYKKEVEALRAENQRVKDAHSAAGLSFSALNQHAANLQRVHKRLLREHQQAVEEAQRLEADSIRDVQRLREEFRRHEEKLQAQARRAKEELTGRIQMYELEVQMRIKQDRTMETMIGLVAKRVGDANHELIQELVEMQHTCKLGIREDVASRSSLIGGISSSTLLGGGGDEGSALSRASKLFSAFGAMVKGEGNF